MKFAVTCEHNTTSRKHCTALADGTPIHTMAAEFNQHSQRVSCAEGTRLETLDTIYSWLKPGNYPSEKILPDKYEASVFWLSGWAGTGKSTIAQRVAEWCDNLKLLGASFFCSRDVAYCSNALLIFPSIAYQLGRINPEFKKQVSEILRSHPGIQTGHVNFQLEKLIVEPLRHTPEFPSCAIVIDALDECQDDETTSMVVKALSKHITDLAPLRFFLTSRPVINIEAGFEDTGLIEDTQHLILHRVHPELTGRDIKLYLSRELKVMANRYQLGDWPSSVEIATLVNRADNLFIFASTAVKFIRDGIDPKDRLQLILDSTSDSAQYASRLDALYLQVLRTAFPDIDGRDRAKLRMVLGTVVLIRDRLSPASLEALLALPSGTAHRTLLRLHSVLEVASPEGTCRLIHPTFSEFLTNGSRCKNRAFVVDNALQHTLIAQQCLETLQQLKYNICNIEDPTKLNEEVPDLAERIVENIPPHLQYACRHWAFHLKESDIHPELLQSLVTFASKYLLHWLETLSLLGELSVVADALPLVRQKLATLILPIPPATKDLLRIFDECERATLIFSPAIRVSSLQVYRSVIPFCPTGTRLSRVYSSQVSGTAKVICGLDNAWGSTRLNEMRGHSDTVMSMACSSDGRLLVSGSKDSTIRLWDARTGTSWPASSQNSKQTVLPARSGRGFVSFVRLSSPSPGTYTICSAVEGAITAWDVNTKDPSPILSDTQLLGFGGKRCHQVAFSPPGQITACTYIGEDNNIAIYRHVSDGETPDELYQHEPVLLTRHTNTIKCLTFSRGGNLLLSSSDDCSLNIWDMNTKPAPECIGHCPSMVPVRKVAISYNDKIVATFPNERHGLRGINPCLLILTLIRRRACFSPWNFPQTACF
ncbi:hypothetical protein OF83DRAFT_131940 [Amylostereum chailletii]|nr:hypothetical protein OF83DRAFT_131940 [Amylostereum chailletii]